MNQSYEETAKRNRTIRWRLDVDEMAQQRVMELKIDGGVSEYLESLVHDDFEDSRRAMVVLEASKPKQS
jgi:hypothetical protein